MDRIQRTVTLPTDLIHAWDLIARPDNLGDWLGGEWLGGDGSFAIEPGSEGELREPDGTRRRMVIDEVSDEVRVAWRWWSDDGDASAVTIDLAPVEGGTRVTIVEQPTPPAEPPSAKASASSSTVRAARAWPRRILHLELLVLLGAAAVPA